MYTTRREPEVGDFSDKRAIRLVRADQVDRYWKGAEPWLEQALEHSEGELGLQEVYDALAAGYMYLFVATGGNETVMAAVIEIAAFPLKKVCRVVLMAGKDVTRYMQDMLDIAEPLAIKLGCTDFEAWVRPSIWRFLRAKGIPFRRSYLLIRKTLAKGLQ